MGKQWKQWQTLFSWAPKITADGDYSHEIKRCSLLRRRAMTSLDNILKSQRHYFASEGPSSQSYGFSRVGRDLAAAAAACTDVRVGYKESWVPKKWCFWRRLWDCKEIKPVNPKGHQSWIFVGRTDVEAGAPILWLPDAKSQFIRKDPDARKDWRQE